MESEGVFIMTLKTKFGASLRYRMESQCIPCLYSCGFGIKKITRILGWKHPASVLKLMRRGGLQVKDPSERNRIAMKRYYASGTVYEARQARALVADLRRDKFLTQQDMFESLPLPPR